MFLTRGYTFSHETVPDWELRFAPLLTSTGRAQDEPFEEQSMRHRSTFSLTPRVGKLHYPAANVAVALLQLKLHIHCRNAVR
jgi:hypothetical protein